MSDPALIALHDEAWALIGATVGHPVAVATRGTDGGARVRLVVLRSASRDMAVLEFWTHAQSGKIAEIAADPDCEVLIWDAESQVQVRLSVVMTVEAGRAEDWDRMGTGARLNYAAVPLPGTPLSSPDAIAPIADAGVFTRVIGEIRSLDLVALSPLPPRRARFGPKGSGASWIAP